MGGTVKPPANSASLMPRASSNSAEGISVGLGYELVTDALVQVPGHCRGEQRSGVLVGQPFDRQRRQVRERLLAGRLPDCHEKQHRLGQQPSADEAQHLRRGSVQPLRIIDQTEQRPSSGHLGQQAQHRQTHDELVRSRTC